MFPKAGNATAPNSASVTVFHVGPQDQDLRVLADILDQSHWQMCPGTSWRLAATDDLPFAMSSLQANGIPIVLCEHDCASSNWKHVLEQLAGFAVPPLLIVASRTADEYLWAEALNLGAYDVLSKPYHAAEVERVFSLACLQWTNRPVTTLARAS